MLRLSKLTDYGIVLLTHLAMGREGESRTAHELAGASAQGRGLFAQLVAAALVHAQRAR